MINRETGCRNSETFWPNWGGYGNKKLYFTPAECGTKCELTR